MLAEILGLAGRAVTEIVGAVIVPPGALIVGGAIEDFEVDRRMFKADPAKLIPMEKVQLEQSDVISFHCYDPLPGMKQWVATLQKQGRPMLCTEYMARPAGSRFDPILGYLKEQKIATFNWGFVAGKSNTIFAWNTWQKPETKAEPDVWFHDIFRPDGSVFDKKEVEYIKSVTGAGK